MRTASLSGPITTGRMRPPVSPLAVDLGAAGYVEEEFFAAGSATAWQPVGDAGPDGRWRVEAVEEAPYRTRLVVRRPVDEKRFSGTVVVEWLNVSGGVEAAPDWSYLHEEILRRGHAHVAVSVQAFGVDGGTPLLEVPGAPPPAGLVGAGPERYGTLAHPGDRFAFDIWSQVGRALRAVGDPAPFGPLLPSVVLGVGESQSAFFLTTYIDAVHHGAEVYDGFLVHSRGGGAASLTGSPMGEDAVAPGLRIRDDVSVPVLVLQTETDLGPLLDFGPARQPDSNRVRTWEVAGTAHADAYLLGPFASHLGCGHAVNDGPHHFVAQAALRALERWIGGAAPPRATPLVLSSTAPPVLARDDDGNALGGVRTPDVDIPVAALSGDAPEGSNVLCALFGTTTPFDGATLRARYGDEEHYLAAYGRSLDEAIAAGFLLAEDRPAMERRAEGVRITG